MSRKSNLLYFFPKRAVAGDCKFAFAVITVTFNDLSIPSCKKRTDNSDTFFISTFSRCI